MFNNKKELYEKITYHLDRKIRCLNEKRRSLKWYQLKRKHIYKKLEEELNEEFDKIYDTYLLELAKQELLNANKEKQNKIEKIKYMGIKLKKLVRKKENLKFYQLKRKYIYKKIIKKYSLEIRKILKMCI